jgi:competence protein ComEC
VSLAVTLTTAPILAYHFGAISLSGVVANVVVAPVLAWVLVLGSGLALALAWVWLDAALVLAWLCERAVRLSFTVLLPLAEAVGDPLVVGRPGPAEVALFYLLLAALAAARESRRLARQARGPALLCAALVALLAQARLAPPGQLEVWFLPVGQGDATVLRLPTGHTIMIDVGGRTPYSEPARSVIVPFLRGLGVRRLDLLVLTHADLDHVGGLATVVEAFPPREVWWNGRDEEPEREGSLASQLDGLARQGTRVRQLGGWEPRQFQLGETRLELLYPSGVPPPANTYADLNGRCFCPAIWRRPARGCCCRMLGPHFGPTCSRRRTTAVGPPARRPCWLRSCHDWPSTR